MHDWLDKVVLVTGGSAGLGRSIAAAFAAQGARVIIVGRDARRLEAALAELNESDGKVAALQADVTVEDQANAAVASAVAQCGRLDVLVNNVGRSARGRLLDTTPAELRALWECNFLSVVHCTRAATPHLTATCGIVVNIGSLASKSAARFLGGYPAAKFAVAAYSQQLRLELADDGVHVLLVCPGPIARSDAGQRYDADTAGLPESARRPGGGVKIRGIPPDELARQILDACRRRQGELIVPGRARWLFALQQLWPRLGDWLLRRQTE